MTTPRSHVIIVGGGVFGLSTALWLARSGYKNVTIYDRCSFEKTHYNPADGCDGASADINKIFRATYGAQQQYVCPLFTWLKKNISELVESETDKMHV